LRRFERLREQAAIAGAEGRPQAARELLASALGLWRGAPLADVADELRLPGELARLAELQLVTLEERIDADLALGHAAALVPELEALVAEQPLRERLRGQLMLALYRVGRQADALSVYRETRRLLVEELGIDPGADLQRLERQILAQEECLLAAPAVDELPRLPAAATPLVGRLRELTELGELLNRSRLVTVVGPGGVGKTRLALAAAEPRPEAVFVSLAPVQAPGLVRAVIARSLGLDSENALGDWLRARELLLVLDNFEHLLDAAPLVADLLAAAPGVRVLVTSRSPLRLSGEYQYLLAPQPLAEAVDLFIERAAAGGAELEQDKSVEAICERLDGLPLAIELTAARAKTVPPEALLERLGKRLALPTRGPRDAPRRQQTLRATIDWSYHLLSASDKQLFARLAVFVGGCTLDAVEEVCDASFDALEALVDDSLLQRNDDRYAMLETIREYAIERLEQANPRQWRQRHAEYFVALAETAELDARRPDQAEWLDRLETEQGNWRAALEFARSEGLTDVELRLVAALGPFWLIRGYLIEGDAWVTDARSRAPVSSAALRCRLITHAYSIALRRGNLDAARNLAIERLEVADELGDAQERARSLIALGIVSGIAGDYDAAEKYLTTVIEGADLLDPWVLAAAQNNLGLNLLETGDAKKAEPLLQEAVRNGRSANSIQQLTGSLRALATAQRLNGQPEAARAPLLEALLLARKMRSPEIAIECLTEATWLMALGDYDEDAARLLGTVEATTKHIGLKQLEGEWLHAEIAATLEDHLGRARFDAAVRQGTRLELEDAIALALERLDENVVGTPPHE
jgi:predicted ATPase